MTDDKKLTRTQAVERLQALLLKYCPDHAVEIFVAVGELQRVTLEEFQAGVMATFEKAGTTS